MATLYEIDQAIMSCIDMESGEIIDAEKLNELHMEREQKLENVACWIKNLNSDAAAYKAEKEAFAEREKQAKAKAESLKNYLVFALNGQKMQTLKCSVSYRKSEVVEIQDETIIPKKFLVKKVEFSPNKAAIKEAIKAGQKVKGAALIENNNIQIK